ncbi:MAG: hypothetical protein IJR97_07710 [Clostridia bacterium]|nr:hypothetical protein [Clostridia bacterium]
MGYSFTNIQIRNTGEAIDCDRLLSILTDGKKLRRVDKAEGADIIIAIIPGRENGWLTVASDLFEEDIEQTITLAKKFSVLLQRETLVIGCFDSDYLFLNLLDNRSGTDAWASCGRYPEGRAPRRSNYTAWKGHVPDVQAFKTAMRLNGAFAEECLENIEPILSLPVSQGQFCAESAMEDETARCFCFTLEEGESKQELPRFSTGRSRSIIYYFDRDNVVSFLNESGSSRGVWVFFSGPVIDQRLVEIESVSIQLRAPHDRWTFVPVEIKEIPTKDGRRWLGGTAPEVRIPKMVPKGLSWKKTMIMEFERTINVRFKLVCITDAPRDEKQQLQVILMPTENHDGQYGCILSSEGTATYPYDNAWYPCPYIPR